MYDMNSDAIRNEAEDLAARVDAVHDALVEREWGAAAAFELVQALATGGYFNRRA